MKQIIAFASSFPLDQIVALGGIVCFLALVGFTMLFWRVQRWKRAYQNLLIRYEVLEERLSLERQHALDKISLLEKAGAEMRLQFKNLSHEIFDEKSRAFRQQNSEAIDGLLRPFQEQIGAFKTRVETIFLEETREHASLKQEITLLRELNQQINEEATNLTRALSGDRKLQGTWGELVLEKLLEQSGLRQGHEYESQPSLRDQENHMFRPDIIVHLPGAKDIVIDSKVSLSAWTRFVAAENDKERDRALAEHKAALSNHLKTLNTKDYSSLKGLRSLDFVLMFVPIDAAFTTAVQYEEQLFSEMYSRKVIIVTPTTLLATLRTIQYFWQLERQNHNALEIAERAGALYDKLRGFLDDMERLGRQIDTCRDSYDKAINKMSRGRGNLLSQASKFPELGVKVKEEIAVSLNSQNIKENSTELN